MSWENHDSNTENHKTKSLMSRTMDMHVHYNSLPPSEKQQCEWSKSELHVWRTWTRIKPFIKFLFRTSFFNQCCPWHCCHGFLNTLFTETSGLEGHCEKKLISLIKRMVTGLEHKATPPALDSSPIARKQLGFFFVLRYFFSNSWKFGRTSKSCGNTCQQLMFPQHFSFFQTFTHLSITW